MKRKQILITPKGKTIIKLKESFTKKDKELLTHIVKNTKSF